MDLSEEEHDDILSICQKESGQTLDSFFYSYKDFIKGATVHRNGLFLISGLKFKKFKLKNYKNYVLTLEKEPDNDSGCIVLRKRVEKT